MTRRVGIRVVTKPRRDPGVREAMDRRRFFRDLGLLGIAVELAWSPGCSRAPRLVVALHPWVGYETLYLSRDLKWLPDTIQLREGKTLGESLDAVKSGQADAACMTLDEMLRARVGGLPLSAALVLDVSAGADMVLARPGIGSLADLAHKRVGLDTGALGALVFEKMLEAAGLSASEVIPVNLPPAEQLDAWHNNEVDAVITYEPLASVFLREGARSLFDSRQMPDTIIDVLAVRRDRRRVLPSVRALAVCHFRALDYMGTNEEDVLYRVSTSEGITPDEARRMLAGVTFPSLAVNRSFLIGSDARLIAAARTMSDLMVQRGLLPQADDLDDLVQPGSLPTEER